MPESGRQTIPCRIQIDLYQGRNPYVRKLQKWIYRELRHELVGAYVHGSIATGEEIAYSDFDALVILKNIPAEDVRRRKIVQQKLHRASRFFYQFDPLQHHGWFVLYEADLQQYPQTYFPVELFAHAKSLLVNEGRSLQIHIPLDGLDYRKPFQDIAASIIQQLTPRPGGGLPGQIPRNVYQLKSLLSRFMLLPALYVQARDQRGIFKKDSFPEAQQDFSAGEWQIMDTVSEIRQNWHYQLNGLQRRGMCRPGKLSRRFAKYFSPKIPPAIARQLTPAFYEAMHRFTRTMRQRLQEKIPREKP